MQVYSEPMFRKKFSSEYSIKDAKLKALKWIGRHVMCRDELRDTSYHLEVCEGEQYPTITLTLLVFVDEGEVREKHCKVCKEFHKSFFINENCNCSECKAMAFKNRAEEMLKVKKRCYKERLRSLLED